MRTRLILCFKLGVLLSPYHKCLGEPRVVKFFTFSAIIERSNELFTGEVAKLKRSGSISWCVSQCKSICCC